MISLFGPVVDMFLQISERGKVAVAAEAISVTDAAFGLRRLAVTLIVFHRLLFLWTGFHFRC